MARARKGQRFGQGPIGPFAPGSELARERKRLGTINYFLISTFFCSPLVSRYIEQY